MPANVSAIVQVARPGLELKCLALEHTLPVNGVPTPHGVLSYYAIKAMPQAGTVQDWHQRILPLIQADTAAGILPLEKRPTLTVAGSGQQILPGTSAR